MQLLHANHSKFQAQNMQINFFWCIKLRLNSHFIKQTSIIGISFNDSAATVLLVADPWINFGFQRGRYLKVPNLATVALGNSVTYAETICFVRFSLDVLQRF